MDAQVVVEISATLSVEIHVNRDVLDVPIIVVLAVEVVQVVLALVEQVVLKGAIMDVKKLVKIRVKMAVLLIVHQVAMVPLLVEHILNKNIKV